MGNEWPAPESPAAARARRKKRDRRIVAAVITIAVLFTVSELIHIVKSNEQPDQPMSLTQAACSMLRDGETADDTYTATKMLAEQHPYEFPDAALAARLAVQHAQAEGC